MIYVNGRTWVHEKENMDVNYEVREKETAFHQLLKPSHEGRRSVKFGCDWWIILCFRMIHNY